MKKIFFLLLILSVSVIGCKKEMTIITTPTPTPTPPSLPPSSGSSALPPKPHAGQNQIIVLPQDTTYLAGGFSFWVKQQHFYNWRKIDGPDPAVIYNPDSLWTKVGNLKKGVYNFELTVTGANQMSGKDTVRIAVVEPSKFDKEKIFTGLTWTFPWYNTLEISNIGSYVPADAPIKVFLQRGFTTGWTEVPLISTYSNNNTEYEYFIETRRDGFGIYTYGSLYIFYYGGNTTDKPNVKIQF